MLNVALGPGEDVGLSAGVRRCRSHREVPCSSSGDTRQDGMSKTRVEGASMTGNQSASTRRLAPTPAVSAASGSPWLSVIVLCVGQMMIVLDQNIVNVVPPTFAPRRREELVISAGAEVGCHV